jgi:riboflavin kinase/FMN adenylyltransferase
MNIYRSLNDVPSFKNAVVTIGSFDGVHLAHKKLIKRVDQIAEEINGEAVVVTFHPHPRSIVFPNDKTLVLLSTIEEKIALFESIGVKHLIIVPFTVEFAQLSANEYVEKFLIKSLQSKYLVVGYDHKFGLARHGDFQLLQMYEKQNAFKLIEIEKQQIDEIAISSTNIRKALINADLTTANDLLGGYYYIEGKVIKGDSIGRTIGFPTANIAIHSKNKLMPPVGIYACFVIVAKRKLQGMLYIGTRPTINDESKLVCEVNIFDFNDNIYDEIIGIEVVACTRKDQKFENLDALKLQLNQDRIDALKVLAKEINKIPKKAIATISILNYNGYNLLQEYLPSVSKSSNAFDLQIQVIDNKSTDDSIRIIKEKFPEVNIIALNENYGFAAGYNKGNKQIISKYTVLLNSDVRVTDGWLDPIIELMEADSKIGAVQPKILSVKEPSKFEYAGASGGLIDALSYPFCRGRIFDNVETDNGQYDNTTEIFWTSGAAMVVRTSLFNNAGGFDADFFAHQEEIDFCWRIKKAGYKCMVLPSSIVFHLGGGTLNYDNPRKTYLNFRNNLNMVLKNEVFPKVIFVFLQRLILDGLAGINFLSKGKINHTLNIVKAHLAVYIALPLTLQKRISQNNFISKYSIDKSNMVGKTNYTILNKYYLQGKRTFSSIQKAN